MQTKIIERYFFFGLLLATFVFSFLIFRPFWVVLVLGISFSIVLYPIYKWLNTKHLPSSLSAFLTVILFTLVLCGPLLGIGTIVFNQSQNVYQVVTDNGNIGQLLNSINRTVNKILPDSIVFDVKDKLTDLVSYVSDNIANIFSTTISAFFSFILMLLIIFYFLKDGERWKKSLVTLSPLEDKDDEKILDRLALSVNAIIKGYLFIALVQGVLMGFGLWLFGVPNPALWGVVAAVTSLLPTVGTALVSVPAIIFLFAIGNNSSAIGLLIWAVIVVGLIDNFLSPFIISKQTNISPLLILFSVLGGISFLGPVGILIGPLAVSLFYTLISIYRSEFNRNTQNATV
ncbi:MAG: AI-2E family transporter [Patescibacteria group bacterium]